MTPEEYKAYKDSLMPTNGPKIPEDPNPKVNPEPEV